ncbi:MAG TPA: ABC transporter ATP-binding protein [bacterium]|nr:ABC transporter ATP-binding protein [bacterium]
MTTDKLFSIKKLKTYFYGKTGFLNLKKYEVKAVDNVNLEINQNEILGLVGESGSGKTTLGRTLLRLAPHTSGEIFYNDIDILKISQSEFRKYRRDLQIIFQDPNSSLNPRMTVGDLLTEPLIEHRIISKKERRLKALELLEIIGLSAEHIDRYPHEFSGGQRQRIVIGRAISLNPKFVVCDEPVSALDVSIRAQILNLMMELKQKYQLTYLFITHDISVVRFIANRIAVMFAGNILELAEDTELFDNPLHPYTELLLTSAPKINIENKNSKTKNNKQIENIKISSSGCPFFFRCEKKKERCAIEKPKLQEIKTNHFAACWFF